MIDYRYLRAFLAAARALNFTRAARDLRISVSALSRQIGLLEKSHGGDLFLRSTRKVALTQLGEKLFGAATRFETEMKACENSVLRIGCLESVFRFFLGPLIKDNPSDFQGPIDLFFEPPEYLESKMANGELDLCITNIAPKASINLSGFKLFREDLSWIGRNLGTERIVIFSAFEAAYSDKERAQKDRIWVNSFHATVELAKLGIGSAQVALPFRNQKKVSSYSQWIWAVTPMYSVIPTPLTSPLRLLRKSTYPH